MSADSRTDGSNKPARLHQVQIRVGCQLHRGHLQGHLTSQALDIDIGVFNVKVQISGSSVSPLQTFYMMGLQ